MKENKITIQINKPVSEVFDFTTNPPMTPQWMDSIVKEITDSHPIKLGTIYKNVGKDGVWSEYSVEQYQPGKVFELKQIGSDYGVRYLYKEITDNITELEYYEWVEQGELNHPLKQATLEKLKAIMEK